jgi:LexA DNA binding domain
MHKRTPITRPQILPLIGKQVKDATFDSGQRLMMKFFDDTILVVGIRSGKLTADVNYGSAQTHSATNAPTKRQLEYLLFISKYMRHFGRAPAESDIERHFLVSAPSVNQMMQMLERRGFISRQPSVPRSTRICFDLGPFAMG